MAQLLERVERGQIITADRWNLMVEAVNELLQTGQTSGINIGATVPAGTVDEPLRVATPLQIVGRNFGYSIGQTQVSFTATGVNVVVRRDELLTGSSDTRLVLNVPSLPGLTSAGMTVTLRVDNGIAHDTRSVLVMPITIGLEGDIFVNWRADIPNPSPNPLVAGGQADFAFNLQAATNIPATFDLTPALSNSTVAIPPGLIEQIQFLDANSGALFGDRRVQLGTSEARNIIARIPQVPSNWTNQSFRFEVTARSGRVVNTGGQNVTVGTPVPQPDPNITAQLTGRTVLDVATGQIDSNPANGALEGTTIRLRAGKRMVLIYNARFTQSGAYDITAEARGGGTLNGWALALNNPASPLTVNSNPQTQLLTFTVTASVGAAATGGVVFRIQRQGETRDWNSDFNLVLLTA